MELNELQELIPEPSKLVSKLDEIAPANDKIYWEPEDHKVMKEEFRPKRRVEVPTGKKDENGEPEYTVNYEELNRVPSSTNKQIVDWAVRMALGVPVELKADPQGKDQETMFAMVKKTLKSNKMEFLDQEIERKKEIYLNALEVWYSEAAPDGFWDGIANGVKFRMRCVILSPEDGDIIIPVFDQYKDLVSVARKFKVKVDGKEINKMELFMPNFIYTFVESNGWGLEKQPVANPYGKLNLVLHSQPRRETQDVEPKLERREIIDSDTADENEASGRPILVATGEVLAVGKRADTGKTFQVSDGGDLKYVEPDGAQESINTERENILKDIFYESATPDMSIFDAEGLGANTPGITIKMRFMPAINKALSKQQGALGMAHQRRINFLKKAMATINTRIAKAESMEISPVFGIYLPENETEKYSNIIALVGAGLLSKKKAIEMLKLVEKPEEEIEQINKELDEASARAAKLVPAPAQAPAA